MPCRAVRSGEINCLSFFLSVCLCRRTGRREGNKVSVCTYHCDHILVHVFRRNVGVLLE